MRLQKFMVGFVMVMQFLTIFVISGCKSSTDAPTVKIGLLTAITDKNNPNFQSDKDDRIQSAQLAVEEINAAGGIHGRKIELIVEDTRNDSLFAAQRARDLISKGVAAIIGPSTSSHLKYIADSVTVRDGIVVISPSATSTDISNLPSDTNNTVFRTCPSDEFQANVAALYINNDLKKNSVAILYVNNNYGKSFSSALTKRLKMRPGSRIVPVAYPADAEDDLGYDFSRFVQQAFRGNPELVYIISTSEAAKILKDMNQYVTSRGIQKPLIMGSDGTYDKRVLNNTDIGFAEGMTGTAPGNSLSDENFQKFLENFQKKFSRRVTSPWGPSTYDAVYLAAFAMAKAPVDSVTNAQPKQLARLISGNIMDVSMAGTPFGVNSFAKAASTLTNGGQIDYEGASGDLDFNQNGDITGGTYLIWKVTGGKYTEARTERYP